ncbi:MAG: C25 family cysteine peptidase [Chitinophagales bacterium]
MRKLLLALLLTLLAPVLLAQNYSNEWIDYSKNYYKLRIAKDGLYRIPFTTLSQSGLANLSGSGFKLYCKGKEVPIYVSTNGSLTSSDYVEFYGEKNDGEFDTQMFLFDDYQLTDETSLFTDSIAYYLVWQSSGSSQRITNVSNNLTNPPTKEPYFMHSENLLHRNIFNVGEPDRIAGVNYNYADFEKGEGFVSSIIQGQTNKTFNINTPALFTGTGAPPANLETKVVGKNNDFFNFKDHHIRIKVDGTTYIDNVYEGYDTPTYTSTVLSSDITSPRTSVVYESVGDIFSTPSQDWQSVAYTKITYPRAFDFLEYSSGSLIPAKSFAFTLNDNADTYIEIKNFTGGSSPVVYDLTNNKRYIPTVQSGIYKIRLQAGTNVNLKRRLLISSTDNGTLGRINSLTEKKFTNYQSIANQGNYIMISHSSLRTGSTDWVKTYANYRDESNGGRFKVVLADIEELYDQFAWGIPNHPLAIRHFINYALDKWSTKPKHVFMIGKSISYRITTTPSTFRANLIPTYGHQPSDNMLGVRNIFGYSVQVGIGRLSANTPTDVRNYFNKIQQYEANEPCTRADRLWRKHALFMATGDNSAQYVEYEGFLNDYKEFFDDATYYGGKVLDIQAAKNYSSSFNTRPFIEEGVSIFTFMGHSTGQIWKTDVLTNPAGYNQPAPRFPMVISGSCFVGDIHKSTNSDASMAEAYVLSNNKGAIGFLATVSFGFPSTLDIYTHELYRQFTGNNGSPINQGKPIGELIKNTLENIYIASPAASFYEGVKATSEEFTFQGDPGLIIGNIKDKPEYIIENNYQYKFIDIPNGYTRKTVSRDDVQVFNEAGSLISSGVNLVEAEAGETLKFLVRSTNLGKAVTNNYSVKISRRVQGSTVATTLKDVSLPSAKYESIHELEIPYPAGTNQNTTYEYIVKVDANNALAEDCEDNNEVILRVRYAPDACNEVANQYANLSITNAQSTYCVTDPAIQLQANINGGSFKISQVGGPTYNVNIFQPSQLGGGQFIITYTITDAGTGCVFSTEESVTVVQPIAVIESVDITEVCVGDEIHIDAAATDGEYIWDFKGATFTGSNQNPTLSWNTPGDKFITLKVSENGCESTTITQLIKVYSQVPENFPIDCDASSTSITFSWNVEGAASFNISGNNVLVTQLSGNANSYTFENLQPEEEVTITVAAIPNGTCDEVQSTLMCKAACGGETPVLDIESSYCAQQTTVINAPIINGVPITNGTFNITLSNGNTTQVSNNLSTSVLLQGENTIVYEYTEEGCTYTSQEYAVTVTNPQVSITGNELICPGDAVTLSVPQTFSAYEWNIPNANGSQLQVSEGGMYSVIVTDANGCTAMDQFEVGMAVDPNGEIFTSSGTSLCDGDNMTLQAPFGYISYIWSNNASNSQTLVVSQPGDYFVNYEDSNGCFWRADITITGPQTPTFEANCNSGTYVIQAMGDYDAYLWEDGSTEPTLAVTSGGLYYVTVTDASDCTSVGLINVSDAPFEVMNVGLSTGEDNAICEGEEITLSITNSTATNVTWSFNGTTQSGNSITANQAGIYVASATIGGCTKTVEQAIVVDPTSQPTAAFTSQSNNICLGESITFSNASANASAYSWTFTNDLSGSILNSIDENPTLSFDEVGNYTVELVVDAACGTKQSTETVNAAFKVSDNPNVTISMPEMSFCAGTSVTLTAEGDGMEYTWDGGEATGTVSDEVKVQPTQTTTYMVTAVNEAGCSETTSITVDVEICNFDIPNVITPNGDNFNDYWHIPQVDAGNNSIYVEIYNRWGQKVYSAINYNNETVRWDGRNDGSDDLPHGTYYYVIELNDGTAPLTGNVTILR